MSEHTPAQLALRRTMEQVGEEHWAAGWYSGLAAIVRRQMGEPAGCGILSTEERSVLQWLAEPAGGWWYGPAGASDPRFVGTREWQRRDEEQEQRP